MLGEEPSGSSLARVSDGYQLWQETRTGLFYLTAHSEPLGRRPDFGQFLDRQIAHRIDMSLLERFMSGGGGALDLKKDDISCDLVHRTATLAKQLDMPVLATEGSDDDYGMAVVVDDGAIKYLRFQSRLKQAAEDEGTVNVVYTPEAGFVIDHEPGEDVYGVAQKAIEEIYGRAGLNLYNYSGAKPTREAARRDAAGQNISIEAYLESYGVFKRIAHAPPQFTLFERLLIPFRFVTSAIVLPFLIVGTVTYASIGHGKRKAGSEPGMGTLILIGMAVLALPIWLIVWLVRSTLGY
ncbi:MAG TPA: hypothetical protein PKC77_02710 [Sphingopyxis sp.]|nr:hypothetical protein [Sphingopyxis sp.]